jgi:NADH-ubiquinone oxidoreductase chain 6
MYNIYNLYVINEIISNGYATIVLNFFSLSSILSGIFVIISKNPIVSVLFLIGLFLSIACYLIVLGLGFIGLSYLLVYIGAVSILFLFILMLINVRISELSSETNNSLPLAIVIGIYFNYSLSQVSPYGLISYVYNIKDILYTNSLSYYINYFGMFGDKKNIFFVTSNA